MAQKFKSTAQAAILAQRHRPSVQIDSLDVGDNLPHGAEPQLVDLTAGHLAQHVLDPLIRI